MVLIQTIITNNCRLCHTNPGVHKLNTDKKLIKEINECVKVKVNDKLMDLLPHSVCDECKRTIKRFSVFKQQTRKIDQCLRKILKNSDFKTEESFSCKKCPATFTNKDVFEKHENSHKLNNTENEEDCKTSITCTFCSESFIEIEEYGSHLCTTDKIKVEGRSKQEDIKLEVDDCPGTIQKYEFAEQLDCETEGKPDTKTNKKSNYICTWPNCHKILTSAYTLKTHGLKHEGKRSFLCVTCGKGFITKNSLTCHEKIHLEVKAYTCKLCNIGFSVRSNLRAHEKKHHEGVRFYCSQCTKAFSSKSSLERHERIHTGIKDFKCNSCTSAFYTNKELLKHQRYHQGLRLHKCDECFKTFFERHHLIIHLRSHTGERPYVCTFPNCGKSFMESQKLKRHHNAKHDQT